MVDDHGVDFVARDAKNGVFYEVQVKSMFKGNYVFMQKDKLVLDDRHLVCFLHFEDDMLPEVYVIPATAWNEPNSVLVDRNYDKPGQKSKPEGGINLLPQFRKGSAFFRYSGNDLLRCHLSE